ncbi:hypothetical protein C357_00384 [Citreicella sp. 357]|nr:hypothetical protein C357_00384 [Citreicella sp. 357]
MIDLIPEDQTLTEVIAGPKVAIEKISGVLAPFPKTVCSTIAQLDDAGIPKKQDFRFGDGLTDGIGIIGVFLNTGELYTSNSQSGGACYPDRTHLNHEMLDVAEFSSTDCYTTGKKNNTVSMDYIFLEAIEKEGVLSGELHLETWDMPLPVPGMEAVLIDDSTVELKITNNGNFLPGGTNVEIDPQIAKVVEVNLINERLARIKFERVDENQILIGKTIKVTSRNVFYLHGFEANIHQK